AKEERRQPPVHGPGEDRGGLPPGLLLPVLAPPFAVVGLLAALLRAPLSEVRQLLLRRLDPAPCCRQAPAQELAAPASARPQPRPPFAPGAPRAPGRPSWAPPRSSAPAGAEPGRPRRPAGADAARASWRRSRCPPPRRPPPPGRTAAPPARP